VTAPAGAARVDLHMHSTASDGSQAPAAVVAAAKAAGIAAIALTDHDTLAGIAEARTAGDALGVRVIAGVELSAMDAAGAEVHILGLHIARPAPLQHALDVFRIARRQRALEIVEKLNALGVPVTKESVLAQAGDAAIGRPHVARALVAGGFARDHREVFDKWLGAGRPAFVEKRRLTMEEAFALIHDAGGIAVIAHPARYKLTPTEDYALFVEFKAHGGRGVEVVTGAHSAADALRYAETAREFGLLASRGSDFHSPGESRIDLGGLPPLPPDLSPVWEALEPRIQAPS
jgi:predicted metal-dependent phosphoesterase TrpH